MVVLRRSFFIFLCVLALSIPVHGRDQSGFISLDCGLQANSSYTDEQTGLKYDSDASYIETGISRRISSEFDLINQQIQNVRSFPDSVRNCYNLKVIEDNKYLIRVILLYGNYDGLNSLPEFDLYLGPNKWDTVQIPNSRIRYIYEMVHVPKLSYVDVCLVKTGNWTPFISALEIRPWQHGLYSSGSEALSLFVRKDVGSSTNQSIRFPDDVYDRFWFSYHLPNYTDIYTMRNISSDLNTKSRPPSAVMRTAETPSNDSEPLEFTVETTVQYHVYMHFAEFVQLEANQSRQFNIYLDGKIWHGPVVPGYLSALTVYSISPLDPGKHVFSLFKIRNSTLPPLLNAFEIYTVIELSQLETHQDDVGTIKKIKSAYGVTRNWQGDPCAPQDFVWEGLRCAYKDADSPRIISLDLSSSGLTGEILPDIINLKSLETLYLSNNSLTGPIPDFLSELPLKSLNLAGNNLTGTIPAGIFDKWQRGLLSLSISGNSELCETVSCTKPKKQKKNNYVVPVLASIAGLCMIVVVLVIILYGLKSRRRKQQVKLSGITEAENKIELTDLRKRQFTHSEIKHITRNFQRILGKGGFGTVYHGHLEDADVAVKVLSPFSVQGYKQYQAEVKHLLRVHHKNLTSLVGYCDEPNKMALIYEYMANGNLKEYLSEGNTKILISWEGRLEIALGAAQGLGYLHCGCRPPIAHRDVKTTNILLNDKFQAKLADFGLSRTFPAESGSHVSTVVAGTPGYLDPEYYVTNWLTEKSDVFSFGVVLLEIITSQPVLSRTRDKTHLGEWVGSVVGTGDIQTIVDPRLRGDFDINSVWKVVELAMACVSATAAERPTMNQVVVELNESLAIELSRRRDSNNFRSRSCVVDMTVNVHTEITPVAR